VADGCHVSDLARVQRSNSHKSQSCTPPRVSLNLTLFIQTIILWWKEAVPCQAASRLSPLQHEHGLLSRHVAARVATTPARTKVSTLKVRRPTEGTPEHGQVPCKGSTHCSSGQLVPHAVMHAVVFAGRYSHCIPKLICGKYVKHCN
jgi:hypothetical protein